MGVTEGCLSCWWWAWVVLVAMDISPSRSQRCVTRWTA